MWATGLSADMTAKLRTLLIEHGVPEKHVDDRVMAVTQQLGAATITAAFASRNSWSHLKAAASKPGTSFRLVQPDELTKHIEKTAANKFGAGIANHKTKKKQDSKGKRPQTEPLTLDPSQVELIANFKDSEDDTVQQIDFDAVEAEATGIAVCSTSQAQHLIKMTKTISTNPLAILLTEVPSDDVCQKFNLEPCTYSAKYKGTGEPILIFGAIKNLGDIAITRDAPKASATPDIIATQVLKVNIFKDEFGGLWSTLIEAPVKTLIQQVPLLQLCAGKDCGPNCSKTHPAVDEALDGVVLEVWGRNFSKIEGGRMPPSEASLFSVFLRIPLSVLSNLLTIMEEGIYFEPRSSTTKAHDEKFRVIWLPARTLSEAQHACRTSVHAMGLVRMKYKYGIRVEAAHEETTFKAIKPDAVFINTQVQRIFQLFPLPHGVQRTGIVKFLKEMNWAAKPLQPGKGQADAMSWMVGSSKPPPAEVAHGFGKEVLITEITKAARPAPPTRLVASTKTQHFLRNEAGGNQIGIADPWTKPQNDPWGSYVGTGSSQPAPANAGKSHLKELTGQLKVDLEKQLKEELAVIKNSAQATGGATQDTQQEQRFQRLETSMSELKQQHNQFGQWFQSLHQKTQETDATLQSIQYALSTHQNEIHGIRTEVQQVSEGIGKQVNQSLKAHKAEMTDEFTKRFDTLEALLHKRSKNE